MNYLKKFNMKYFLLISLILVNSGCKPQPEFYINGKPYYTDTYCVKSHTKEDYTYHYGYNILSGKYEWHWGWETETICDETKTDTIEIK